MQNLSDVTDLFEFKIVEKEMNDLRVINEVYVGRQAIFNAKKEVVAYELLFRDGLLNYCSQEDSETATTDVIVNSLLN